MLFAVMGFLKPGMKHLADRNQANMNEHLGQPILNLKLAGSLNDAHGAPVGLMVIIEAKDFAAAQAYLHESPNFQLDMYERTEVVEYALQVGTL